MEAKRKVLQEAGPGLLLLGPAGGEEEDNPWTEKWEVPGDSAVESLSDMVDMKVRTGTKI